MSFFFSLSLSLLGPPCTRGVQLYLYGEEEGGYVTRYLANLRKLTYRILIAGICKKLELRSAVIFLALHVLTVRSRKKKIDIYIKLR